MAAVLAAVLCGAGPALAQAESPTSAEALLAGFQTPPQAAKPRVWWHWLGGAVTLEGAKLDLEWMQRVGLGGVHTFSGGGFGEAKIVDTPLPFMSPGWREAFRETTRIAHGYGMEVGIAGSPGWSETGGIWVAPQDAMKKYVWSTMQVEGGKPFVGALPKPPSATGPFLGNARPSKAKEAGAGYYGDGFVIAFPTPLPEQAAHPATYQSSAGPIDLAPIAAGDLSASINLPIEAGQTSAWIQTTFTKPTRVFAVTVAATATGSLDVLASNDGRTFRSLTHVTLPSGEEVDRPAPQQTLAIPPTTAMVFRVVFAPQAPPTPLPGSPRARRAPFPPPTAYGLAALAFDTEPRVDHFEAKAGFQSSIEAQHAETPDVPAEAVVDAAKVIDLTDRMTPDGHLDWTPPAGRWTVMRFGWSLTGQTNGPAEAEATGLEVDKLDPVAVRRYIDTYLALYSDITGGKLGPDGVQNLLTDSWEAGPQNWTPGLFAEFRRRRGYDPLPYAPVLAGRVVTSAVASERFLWDYRLTLKELLADAHYGVLAKAMHDHGMGYYTEAEGDTPRALGDGMTIKARSDIPTAEYWYRPFAAGPGQFSLKADLEEAASAAHVYGKPLAAAESLTVAAGEDPFAFSPAMLKPVADEIFARGINRILVHDSRHQPLKDAKPGVWMFIFGQFFNRNDTWAEDAKPWVDYLARTSYMLQQGRYVADVAYFYGEDRNLTQLMRRRLNTDVPDGYRYDYINREALLTLLSVKNGRLVTPSGMAYRILYMPEHVTRLTLPAMRRLRELVAAGAVVVGPKPVGGLGLSSPDAEVRRIADEVWGTDAPKPEGHVFGAGKVYRTMAAGLAGQRVAPDFQFEERSADGLILSLHRRTEAADIYFVANQKNRAEDVQAVFRVAGRAPELWRAETGTAEALSFRQIANGATNVPLHLDPNEAVFVVFQRKVQALAWQAPARQTAVLATLEGPWFVRFEAGRGAPAEATFDHLMSWPDAADSGVKYFSGGATYRKTITAPVVWKAADQRILLDLGEVRELAVVSVDGKLVGTAWRPPYRLDVTDALKPGRNDIEIRVVNLWPNRLIGDKQPGATAVAFAPQSPYLANSPLLRSGLLGPVILYSERNGEAVH